eukprot:1534240-Pyramimonas_sp.AAC.1
MVWMALLVSNLGGALKRSGATLQSAKAAADQAAATGTTPDFSNLPGGQKVTPQTPSFAAGASDMTFRCVKITRHDIPLRSVLQARARLLPRTHLQVPTPSSARFPELQSESS